MIHLFYGDDYQRCHEAVQELLIQSTVESVAFTTFRFSSEDYSREKLEEAFLGQTLLGDRLIIVLENLWSTEEEFLRENLAIAAGSPDLFIFLETESIATKAIEAVGGKVKEFKRAVIATAVVNLFRLADALGERDRRQAWILYEEALWRGVAAEEIFWKIVWKVKTLLLVKVATPGEETGLKPYPLTQAKRQSQKFERLELEQLSARLVSLWHDSRRGLLDFETNLERLILEV